MLLNSLNRDMLNHFVLIEVCSFDFLIACWRICTGFKGIPSERRIYESTFVGETKMLSKHVSKLKRTRRFSECRIVCVCVFYGVSLGPFEPGVSKSLPHTAGSLSPTQESSTLFGHSGAQGAKGPGIPRGTLARTPHVFADTPGDTQTRRA